MDTINSFLLLDNPVKDYSWGHEALINGLLGRPATPGKPQAELWMGAHPGGPSRVVSGAGPEDGLDRLIAADPAGLLGPVLTARGIRGLPFLFKVLAAATPLSIQAHPSLAAARAGCAAEDAAGLARNDPRRNYKDDNHKPETICALTEFWGLCGFRPADEIRADFRLLASHARGDAAGWFAGLAASGRREGLLAANYCHLVTAAILEAGGLREALVEAALACAEVQSGERWRFMRETAVHYPGDAGLLFLVVLQLHRLQPGDSLSIPAGVLHAYLRGFGVELMANSDNVLRGGLTPKHVDARELLANLDFAASGCRVDARPGERLTRYPAFTPEFCLSRLAAGEGAVGLGAAETPWIAICTEGRALLRGSDGAECRLDRGQSVYVVPRGQTVSAETDGGLFIAAVPLSLGTGGLVLGVDGGGTSTRACLMDASGAVLGIGRSGASSIDTVSPAQTEEAFREALAAARRQAGTDAPITRVVCGLGGIVSEADEAAVSAILAGLPGVAPGTPCAAMNDMKTALAAGTGLQPGITCILGTGSVAYGRNSRGEEFKSGGWGWKEGDPGSSFDLGISAIRCMVRAYDGRLEGSGFTAAVFDRLGLERVGDITRRLYQEDLGRTEIAGLAPVVTEWANRGDRLARTIVDQAVGEVTGSILAVFRVLFADAAAPVPVAIVGSLGNAAGYYHDSLAESLRRADPRLGMQRARLEPVVASALMALRANGVEVGEELIGRLAVAG
jgi:mannose-6-phosphate isomerase